MGKRRKIKDIKSRVVELEKKVAYLEVMLRPATAPQGRGIDDGFWLSEPATARGTITISATRAATSNN